MAARASNEPTNYFAVGVQPAKDTEATVFFFHKHLDGTGFDVEEDIQSVREGGDGQEVGFNYKQMVKADGNVTHIARVGAAGRTLSACLGVDTVASAAAGQTHTITPAPTLPYLTVEQYHSDQVERVTNVNFTGVTIEGEAGKPIQITAPFISGGSNYSRDVASIMTAARETNRPFFYPRASVAIDGSGNTTVTKFKVEVKRGVDDGIQTVGLNREDVVPQNFDVDLDMTLKYESKTFHDKIKYGGGTQVPIDLATGAFSFYTQVGSQYLRVALPLVEYTGAKVNKLDPDGKTVYLDVTAMTVKNATHAIWCEVRDTVNATAGYLTSS